MITITEKEIQQLENLANTIKDLIKENQNLGLWNELLQQQLFCILINHNGELKDLRKDWDKKYDDFNVVDFKKIKITAGLDSCSIIDKTNKKIKSWNDVPIKAIKE